MTLAFKQALGGKIHIGLAGANPNCAPNRGYSHNLRDIGKEIVSRAKPENFCSKCCSVLAAEQHIANARGQS